MYKLFECVKSGGGKMVAGQEPISFGLPVSGDTVLIRSTGVSIYLLVHHVDGGFVYGEIVKVLPMADACQSTGDLSDGDKLKVEVENVTVTIRQS